MRWAQCGGQSQEGFPEEGPSPKFHSGRFLLPTDTRAPQAAPVEATPHALSSLRPPVTKWSFALHWSRKAIAPGSLAGERHHRYTCMSDAAGTGAVGSWGVWGLHPHAASAGVSSPLECSHPGPIQDRAQPAFGEPHMHPLPGMDAPFPRKRALAEAREDPRDSTVAQSGAGHELVNTFQNVPQGQCFREPSAWSMSSGWEDFQELPRPRVSAGHRPWVRATGGCGTAQASLPGSFQEPSHPGRQRA